MKLSFSAWWFVYLLSLTPVTLLLPLDLRSQSLKPELRDIPLAFEKNAGQAPTRYQFLVRRSGATTLYLQDGFDVVLPESKDRVQPLRVRWVGSEKAAFPLEEEPLQGYSSYFLGRDSSRWITRVPQFGELRYKEIYPGIDVVFHGNGNSLEQDFLLKQNADPGRIRIHIDQPVSVDRSGNLIVSVGAAKMSLLRPVAYQELSTGRRMVSASFILARNGDVKFKLGSYDRSMPLTIDPIFAFSTFLDGTNTDTIQAVTTDPSGNIYVTGFTNSTDFPITNTSTPLCPTCIAANSQAFVSKLDPTGHTLLFSTYLGGSSGAFAHAIALDSNLNIHVGGVTSSTDFPHAGAIQSPNNTAANIEDFFLTTIKADGSSLIFSGTVGGEASSFLNGNLGLVAVDNAGNTYLAGGANPNQFQLTAGTVGSTPVPGASDQGFVLKVSATGSLVYSTLIPGNIPAPVGSGVFNDFFLPTGMLVDANGQVTVTGNGGLGLPTTPGVVQPTFPNTTNAADPVAGFVLQLNAGATQFNFATYLTGVDTAGALAVDKLGNFYVAGVTGETNLPVHAAAFQKSFQRTSLCNCAGFILKLDSQGKTIPAATYMSGPSGARFLGIAVDSNSNVFVGGWGFGNDFPLKNPFTSYYQGSSTIADTVLAQLDGNLSALQFGSYLSGNAFPYPGSQFSALTLDHNDDPIIVGTSYAADFPTTAGSFQKTPPPPPNPLSIVQHSFVAKLDLATPAPSVCLASSSLDLGTVTVGTSSPVSLSVTNCGNAPLVISGATSSLATVVVGQNCPSIAVGTTCPLQVTFSPTDGSNVSGTITLNDNAATPTQNISFSGQGGLPQVIFPLEISVSDLLVGTQGPDQIFLPNTGNGNWIIKSVTATGDFSIDAPCPATVGWPNLQNTTNLETFCLLGLKFSPSTAGVRTGTLMFTDNIPGSPHVIQLTGKGLTSYPVPAIAAILALPTDNIKLPFVIAGSNFFPASQVAINGAAHAFDYVSETNLDATATPSDIAQVGELPVSVSNPAPGGGVSGVGTATVYAAIRNIQILHTAVDSVTGLLYSTISAQSPIHAGRVIEIDPVSASIVNSWNVGNGPNQIAISGDGKLLYVGLDDDKKVAQVAIPSGTVNFAVGIGTDSLFHNPMIADAIRVLPGNSHAWVVTQCGVGFSPCGQGIAVFDDATPRPTQVIQDQLQPGSLVFIGNDATTLYGTTLLQSPASTYKFAITPSGITKLLEVQDFTGTLPGGGILDTDGNLIYTSRGEVINPSDLTVKSTFSVPQFASAIRVDAGNSRIYVAGFPSQQPIPAESALTALGLATQQPIQGILGFEEFLSQPEIFRWSTNGIAVNSGNAMLLFRTSLTGNSTAQIIVTGNSDANVVSGQDAQYILNVAPGAGFSGTVTFSCTNLPAHASCKFNPANTNLSSAAVGVTVTISTSDASPAALLALGARGGPGSSEASLPLLSCVLILPLAIVVRRKGKAIPAALCLVLALLVVCPFAGCGGGGTTITPPPVIQKTAAGTYHVNFVASGQGASSTTSLTLVVQ